MVRIVSEFVISLLVVAIFTSALVILTNEADFKIACIDAGKSVVEGNCVDE